ncbi:SOS response-associated peptidase family protein [Acidovorax sp. LjRoot66]
MCYSAQTWADFRRYTRAYGVDIDIREFYRLFVRRNGGAKLPVPKALEDAFLNDPDPKMAEIAALVRQHREAEAVRLQQLVFEQKARLVEADRQLVQKLTKKWSEERRIATDKIEGALQKLAHLNRAQPRDSDSRIYPGYYLPVMIWEDGRRVLRPMRYLCRPPGKPEANDHRFPGTYNARMTSLEGYWSGVFGITHGVVLASAFYEHVNRHRAEQRALAEGEKVEDVILEFKPRPEHNMLLACVWAHWTAPGKEDLYSVALVTDDPPPEVSQAGHDRCVIPIDPSNLDAWLQPDRNNLAESYRILREKEAIRPYYEHRIAA